MTGQSFCRVKFIAEAGVNHNGDVGLAREMIDCAEDAGADFIKFQWFSSDNLVRKNADCADYQKRNCSATDISQHKMLTKLELSRDDFESLVEYTAPKKVRFLATPFDEYALSALLAMGCRFIKISSGDLNDYFLLRSIAESDCNVILSTGMSDLNLIKRTFDFLLANGLSKESITLLHCTSDYPCPIRDVNLRAMSTLKETFDCVVGYSDHTSGIEVSIAAVALGANVIEKHFTLDKTFVGPDHSASLDPKQLKDLISAVRNIELALGDGVKRITPGEANVRKVARKSLVAKNPIFKGQLFSSENVSSKRPATGRDPMDFIEISGSRARRDYRVDEDI